MENPLIHETSTYLQQHAHNPVRWMPYGEDALRQAREENRLLLISIGYATCHWCHVMAQESFAFEQVAQAMHPFVCVKVDREQHPDVDAVYMRFAQAQMGSGGWPLNVFCLPDGTPALAVTYLPQAAWISLCEQVQQLWEAHPQALIDDARALVKAIHRAEPGRLGRAGMPLVKGQVQMLVQAYDAVHGGFGDAPKFPMGHQLWFLLRYARVTRSTHARDMAVHTLQKLRDSGLWDAVGDGFMRYATDRAWRVPHFEKMLYDNALLLLAYAEAFAQTGKPLFADTCRRIVGYLRRELQDESGLLTAGQDADSQGREGGYYLWTQEELSQALSGEQLQTLLQRYELQEVEVRDGVSHCHLVHHAGQPEMEEATRKALDHARARRPLQRDQTCVVQWNALLIGALCEAAQALGERAWVQWAEQLDAICETRARRPDGQRALSLTQGQPGQVALLDDLACGAWAAVQLYRQTLDAVYLQRAVARTAEMVRRFAAPDGGFTQSGVGNAPLPLRLKETYDGALPSGNAMAALALVQLAELTGDPAWQTQAAAQLQFLAGAMLHEPYGHSVAALAMMRALSDPPSLLCAVEEEDETLRRALVDFAAQADAHVLLLTKDNQALLHQLAPRSKEIPVQAQARYFLCAHGACYPPVDSLKDVAGLCGWAGDRASGPS